MIRNGDSRGAATTGHPKLKFHSVHRGDVQFEKSRHRAKISEEWACGGIVFSNRPIERGERVSIRLTDITEWSRLSFGYTSIDPASYDVRNFGRIDNLFDARHQGYWLVPLSVMQRVTIFEFFVSMSGAVHYSINGGIESIAINVNDLHSPLWALIVTSGAVTVQITRTASSTVSMPSTVGRAPGQPQVVAPLRTDAPLKFHALHSDGIRMKPGNRRAVVHAGGIVFSHRPIAIEERVSIRLESIQKMTMLFFGITSICPDAHQRDFRGQIRIFSDLEQPAYWKQQAYIKSRKEGYVLEFFVSSGGVIHYSINGESYHSTLTVRDTEFPLWAMIEVIGYSTIINIAGSSTTALIPAPQTTPSTDPSSSSNNSECSICMERAVNAAIVACGHMHFCYECTMECKNTTGTCPICRQRITSVLKIYSK